jgi:colanic acid/amylovoran biosynthesis glycosyltransferase
MSDDHAPARPGRPVVAIFRSPLFNASETFVQAHGEGLERYRALFVGLEDKGHARPGLEHRRIFAASRWESLALRLLGNGGAMARRLADRDVRLVHAHFGTDGLLALPIARQLGVPLVTTLHGYDVSVSTARLLASGRLSWMRYALLRRRLASAGDLFLAVSEAVRQRAIAGGFPADRTITHYLGIDLATPFREPKAPEPGRILHVGRLVEKKGTKTLLDAFAGLRERRGDCRLIVVGDGPERIALERQAAMLGIAAAVAFRGTLSHDETLAEFARAWVLAAPSLTGRSGDAEGLPTVILEAAAAGVPTVATFHSGIPEAVVDGRTGFLVAENDSRALAERLEQVLGSLELRTGFGAAARFLAADRFDRRLQSARLESLYDGLLGQTRSFASR